MASLSPYNGPRGFLDGVSYKAGKSDTPSALGSVGRENDRLVVDGPTVTMQSHVCDEIPPELNGTCARVKWKNSAEIVIRV